MLMNRALGTVLTIAAIAGAGGRASLAEVRVVMSSQDGSRDLDAEAAALCPSGRPCPHPYRFPAAVHPRIRRFVRSRDLREPLQAHAGGARRGHEKLMDPGHGIGMNLMRVCIGTSDFVGEPYYTYNDLPEGETDPEFTRFSIEKDRAYVLPAIQLALKKNPDLLLFASPWSPPAWMKTSGKLGTGRVKPEFYPAFARYLLKFIRAYEAEGVPIHAITVQNEPQHRIAIRPPSGARRNSAISSATISARSSRSTGKDPDLVLGPQLEPDRVPAHDPLRPPGCPLRGRHGFPPLRGQGGGAVRLQQEFPDKHIYFTEGSVFRPGARFA